MFLFIFLLVSILSVFNVQPSLGFYEYLICLFSVFSILSLVLGLSLVICYSPASFFQVHNLSDF